MEGLGPARELLHRVRSRDLYKHVGQVVLPSPAQWLFPRTARGRVDETAVHDSIAEDAAAHLRTAHAMELPPNVIIVDVVRLNYGQGQVNPMENVGFYSRVDVLFGGMPAAAEASSSMSAAPESSLMMARPIVVRKAFRIPKTHVSALLPQEFEENTLRVFCKSKDLRVIEAVHEGFRRWTARFVPDRAPRMTAAPASRSSSMSGSSAAASTPRADSPAAAPSSPRAIPAGDASAIVAGSAPPTVRAPKRRHDGSTTALHQISEDFQEETLDDLDDESCRFQPQRVPQLA